RVPLRRDHGQAGTRGYQIGGSGMGSIQRRALTLVAAGAFVSGGLLVVPGPLPAQAAGNHGRWTRSGPPPRVEAAGTPAQGADKGPSSASHFAQLHAQRQLVANQA